MEIKTRDPDAQAGSLIEESLAVRSSFERGLVHLRSFFHAYERIGAAAKIDLDVTATILGLEQPLHMRRCAIATLAPVSTSRTGDACYRVSWEPAVPGPYPIFSGELFREPSAMRGSFVLRLHGVYTPPLAFLGSGHDVIGNHLATATAHQLLCEMRGFIEREERNARSKRTRKSSDREVSSFSHL